MTRWLLLGAAVLLFVMYGWPAITGKSGKSDVQPLGFRDDTAAEKGADEQLCNITGPRFHAALTTKGGALRHYRLDDAKYQHNGKPTDLVTTTVPSRLPLRTDLRTPPIAGLNPSGAPDQVVYDDLDWKLASSTPTSCTFQYDDDAVSITKVVSSNDRPFELTVSLSVTNKDKKARVHRLTIENGDWHRFEDTQGSLGRQSEFLTSTAIYAGGKMVRSEVGDFEPEDFKDKEFNSEKWRAAPGDARMVAVSSSYFSKALMPVKGPVTPTGEAQIEERFNAKQFADKHKDPSFGHVYRARLNYSVRTLAENETAHYEMLAFAGPKEREVLAHVANGQYPTTELLDLGMFGWIGKLLIRYLYLLYRLVASWGWAICLLTITVKVVLFPLSIAQIKSTMAMRKLKPEMDAINAKYKDDAQQRGLALQELWRKNKVANPMLGCLPVLLQMPVWWALYTALQTAVELYHTPFGPFIPDLSAPGKYFIIPALLGISSWLQQHLMPMQGDPMQQKMMKYMMPAIFTVMMLFLPAGLGIYFLTNTWLGIIQQVAVERYYESQKKTDEPTADVEESKGFGKGKSRVQQRG
jgi:YidC/Oxa1 family membrane protein insertase